jgi:D-glycero-D-manno-heptose 1,7-bisphosphate phosphatase
VAERRPCLFLDRDGVINVDYGYVHTTERFEWLPGVFEMARAARDAGLVIVVVTNQAGIGRGFYTTEQFESLTEWMRSHFAAAEAPLAAVYYCPYHGEGLGKYRVQNHPDRKPNPGMILRAAAELDLDVAASIMLGDKPSDVQAARRAGVGTVCLFGAAPDCPGDADLAVPDHAFMARWLGSATARRRAAH